MATVLIQLNQFDKARACIAEAIAELRRFIGHERQLFQSLNIAATIEMNLKNRTAEKNLREEMAKIADELQDTRFIQQMKLAELLESPREHPLEELDAIIGESNDDELLFWRHFLLAKRTDDLDTVLINAESALSNISSINEHKDKEQVVHWLLAKAFHQHGKINRAIASYRRVLEISPWTYNARASLLQLLWNENRWSESVSFLEDQLKRFGNLPGLLFAYGRSLLETGRQQDAADALSEAIRLGGSNKKQAEALLLKAIEQGAEPHFSREPGQKREVSLDEFREQLSSFAETVADNHRMSFWRSRREGKNRHVWREYPEDHGKQLLMMALTTAFGSDVEVLDEVSAGAGRIDLYVRLGAVLKVVVELKMCGGGSYSTKYALEGIDQLVHYMEAKATNVGFLVVFDGRLRDFGKGLSETETHDKKTIYIQNVDLRATVKAMEI